MDAIRKKIKKVNDAEDKVQKQYKTATGIK